MSPSQQFFFLNASLYINFVRHIFKKKNRHLFIQKPSSFMKDHIDVCNWTGVVHLYVGFLCQELREGPHGQGRPP